MISTFALNSKAYSDFPLTYKPATGFKWHLLSLYIASSATGMTASIIVVRNGSADLTVLSTTSAAWLASISGAGTTMYSPEEIGSLDALKVVQSGGAAGDVISGAFILEVLPA